MAFLAIFFEISAYFFIWLFRYVLRIGQSIHYHEF